MYSEYSLGPERWRSAEVFQRRLETQQGLVATSLTPSPQRARHDSPAWDGRLSVQLDTVIPALQIDNHIERS